jgi:hypothetical protein
MIGTLFCRLERKETETKLLDLFRMSWKDYKITEFTAKYWGKKLAEFVQKDF